MSAINQMLRDLDKRKALAPGAAPDAAPASGAAAPNRLASAYASVRLIGPRTPSRHLLLAAGVAALLPIAWATHHFDLPAMAVQAAPAPVAATDSAAAPVRVATAPMAGPAAASSASEAAVTGSAQASIAAPVSAPNAAPDVAPSAATVATNAGTNAAPRAAPNVAPSAATVATTNAAPLAGLTTASAVASAPTPAPTAVNPGRPVAVLSLTPPMATLATDASRPPSDASAPPTAPTGSKNRLVRAPVLQALNGEDDTPLPTARQAAPRDTRLALASPTVPKDEARIERRPTDARDDLVRAGEAMSIGRTSDAIVLLRKVILAEPDNERARLALLSLLAERGRDETWRATLADSAKALPKRFGLAAAQGMAESGRFEESLSILRSLPESVRDTRYFSALGATHQQLNQHADAVAAFDAALGTAAGNSPQLPSLLVAQALSMQSLGKTTEARSNLERVRQMPEAAADVRDFAVRELAHSR